MRHDFSRLNKKVCGIVILVCLSCIALILYASAKDSAPKQREVIKPEVRVQEVKRQAMYKRIVLSGQTVAKAKVDIAPKYAGRIVDVRVELGEEVRQGDILLVQDTEEVDIALRQNRAAARAAAADVIEAQAAYESNLADKKSQYEHDCRNYERYEALFQEGAVSREAFDDAGQQLATSRAALDALVNQHIGGGIAAVVEGKRAARDKAEHEITALSKERSELILRAPRDGVIGYRDAEVGAIASAGQRVLSVVDNSSMYVDCDVSEQDVAVIQPGQTTTVAVESLGQSFTGSIIYVSPAVNDVQRSYTVRIELDNTAGRLRDGMFARGQIRVLQREAALSVSKDAVVEKNGRTYVYVLGEAQTVGVRDVELGLRNDEMVEIISGIREGEQLILNNFARLKEGVAVTLEQAGGAA